MAAKNRCLGSIDEMIPGLLVRTEMSFCREQVQCAARSR